MRLICLVLLGIALATPSTLDAQEIMTTQPSGPPGMRGRGGGRGRAPGEAPPAGREAVGPASQPAGASTGGAPAEPVSSEHEIVIDGSVFKYKATAGTLPLKDDAGKTRANMFFVAYEKAIAAPTTQPSSGPTTEPVSRRPLTFVFNGGPGAAAIWLHLGTAGPKRVHLPENGWPPAPPFTLDDNPTTWLAVTDLCFIDPVGTGYSRPESPDRGREFYGVRQDLDSVSEFIRDYCTKYQRWPSAKFLAGESYGTTRAAGLSDLLLERYGIALNGIVLISTVLNFQTLDFSGGNDAAYPLYVPSYTAIAWYHKKLAPDLQADMQKAIAQSKAWALGDYHNALLRGTSLPDADRTKVLEQLARFTGLPKDYVDRSNLRVSPNRFEKSLLAGERKIIGRMDGRITAYDSDPLNDSPEFDPAVSGYVGPFSSDFNDYVRRELKYESTLTYEFLTGNVQPWDFGAAGRGYLDVAGTLRRCMVKIPSLKVFIASGYFDLATPFCGIDSTVNQMPLSKELRGNIKQGYYEGGHMIYLNRPAMEKLNGDLREFFDSAAK